MVWTVENGAYTGTGGGKFSPDATCMRAQAVTFLQRAMTKTADGFKIAEEDLRLRGPGDFFGLRQHGLPGLRVADIGCDTRLLTEAQTAAEELLAHDPSLARHPDTAERVQKLFRQSENSLN